MIRSLTLTLLTMTLAACATPKLDVAAKASIRSIYVEPAQLPDKPSVAPPQGGALAITSGKVPDSPQEAAVQYRELLARHVDLGKVIRDQAKRELERKGYAVVDNPAQADARLRFIVFYGLGVASAFGDARGVATTVNMELLRAADGKRLVFSIANVVSDPAAKAQLRTARFEEWFSDGEFAASQHRLVAESLTAQSMQGL